jgi:hypothetical protein
MIFICNRLLASNVRHDGRAFAACRDMRLSSDVVHALLTSASLSIGRTVVIAGIQAMPGDLPIISTRFFFCVLTYSQLPLTRCFQHVVFLVLTHLDPFYVY